MTHKIPGKKSFSGLGQNSNPTNLENGESVGHIATLAGFSPTGGVITILFKPAVVAFRFLNRLTSLKAWQMSDKTSMDANVKSALFPDLS